MLLLLILCMVQFLLELACLKSYLTDVRGVCVCVCVCVCVEWLSSLCTSIVLILRVLKMFLSDFACVENVFA